MDQLAYLANVGNLVYLDYLAWLDQGVFTGPCCQGCFQRMHARYQMEMVARGLDVESTVVLMHTPNIARAPYCIGMVLQQVSQVRLRQVVD